MKIAINALVLCEEKTGISVYAKNLIENLLKMDSQNHYVIFVRKKMAFNNFQPERHRIVPLYCTKNILMRTILEQIVLPFLLLYFRIDVLHCLSFTAPMIKFCKYIVTIHDLAYKIFPESIPKVKLFYYNVFFSLCAKRSDKIIAVSKNTKNDIVRFFKIQEKNIQVILLGVHQALAEKKESSIPGLPGEYLLFIGAIEPRKNLLRLVQAYSLLRDKIQTKLVLAGPKGNAYAEILSEIQKLHLEKDIIFTGYIDDSMLPSLFKKAKIFLFPSLYEGFGLPVLEAMAYGTPVISAKNSSLPEVCQDCAVYVQADDVKGISEAILYLLQQPGLRESLKQKGLDHSQKFSWKKTALETLETYNSMLLNI